MPLSTRTPRSRLAPGSEPLIGAGLLASNVVEDFLVRFGLIDDLLSSSSQSSSWAPSVPAFPPADAALSGLTRRSPWQKGRLTKPVARLGLVGVVVGGDERGGSSPGLAG